jgi:25S rRNA (uracil2634-N3)-methyltransferase
VIVGFLRSAAGFLTLGSMPSIFTPKKHKQNLDGDEDDNECPDDVAQENNIDMSSSRGTALITLRNVPPYTLWCVHRSSLISLL